MAIGRTNYVKVETIEEWKLLCELENYEFIEGYIEGDVGFETDCNIDTDNILPLFAKLLKDDEKMIFTFIDEDDVFGYSIGIDNKLNEEHKGLEF